MFYDSDDCLWLFRLISVDIYQLKPMKFLLKLTFFSVVVFTGIQTVIFLKKLEIYYFVKYQPLYFGSFFILVTIYSGFYISEAAHNFMRQIEPWPINRLGPVLEKRIKRQSVYFNIVLIVSTVVSLISGILHVLPIEDDEEIFYTLAFFQEYFPKWQRYLCFVYRMSFMLLAIVMPAPFFTFIYLACHGQFQISMMVQVLKRINKPNHSEESDLLVDKKYQERTNNLLKFSIKRHSQLINAGREAMSRVRFCCFLISISIAILFLCVIVFLLSFQGTFEGRYLRLATLIFPAGVIFVHAFFLGQGVENMSTQTFEVMLQSSWYQWNKENKKIYLINLAYCKNPFKLEFNHSLSLGYELAVSILKSVYSVLSVMGYLKR
ncbi:hypothetical protein Zmor_008250 [Zophobas morio]|uniref:Odorant receptor n=1 Tax=Zophobas morio TaxID=2755281 RepID=A0AA38MQN0_9CUCU|nr:hypothetical protein Zmor_008250 [Zophobas morio]